MSFDLHQTFQDVMKIKADVMSGYHIISGEPEARTHIQVDQFCIADLNRPYKGPEKGIRPLADFKRYNVIELEGLGRTLSQGRFRYHVGRTLVMENPAGKPSRQGQIGLTILTVHKPIKLLAIDHYSFKKVEPWKYQTTVMEDLPVTIIVLRELQKVNGGEASAWLQLLEPDPELRPTVWSHILGQDLTSRERFKKTMMEMDEEAFMTVAEEFRVEGRAEGRVEERIEMIKNMIRNGVKTAIILDVSGITHEQFDKIKAEMESGS